MEIIDSLSKNGLLAKNIKDFVVREPQIQMAKAVFQALGAQSTLLVEAGTGTGKTFAYLVPSLLSGKKILISTGTRNLQDQLFHRDLPLLIKTLGVPTQLSLLKGRANYLCWHRLKQADTEAVLPRRKNIDELQKIVRWSHQTATGDIAELTDIPEASEVWPFVTSTVDNCLGTECPSYANCFVVKARQKAQKSTVVVVNHHLFFADLSLKENGFSDLLPEYDAFIFDEAHQLPTIASHFFGTRFSSRQVSDLIRDVRVEYLSCAKDMAQLDAACDRLDFSIKDMRLAFAIPVQKKPWFDVAKADNMINAIGKVHEDFQFLSEVLELSQQRSKGLEQCHQRCVELFALFTQLTGASPNDQIHWYETFARTFSIHFTPMDSSKVFSQIYDKKSAVWVFTSATLAVGDDFTHIKASLGIGESRCLQLHSPYDFAKQTLLYIPRSLPDPGSSEYLERVVHASLPVLNASRGRTFFLFTSHRAMQNAFTLLQDKIDYPLMIQGSLPKMELLDQFRTSGEAILLATGSFWEGVDVKGEALSTVIIDKLPFAVPDEPVVKARLQALKQQGLDPFISHQIPHSVMSLKQGVGRLIRDSLDRGVVMICDPRLGGRYYGKYFLSSLPPMKITRELSRVEAFYAPNRGI